MNLLKVDNVRDVRNIFWHHKLASPGFKRDGTGLKPSFFLFHCASLCINTLEPHYTLVAFCIAAKFKPVLSEAVKCRSP